MRNDELAVLKAGAHVAKNEVHNVPGHGCVYEYVCPVLFL